MATRVGLMGFGRIGRNVFRILHDRNDIEIAAIVDIAEPEALEYLLRFDTVHGRFDQPVWVKGGTLYTRGRAVTLLQAKAPGDVDWKALGVDIVVEATGQYRTREVLQRHLDKGASRVVLTVPPRDAIDALVVMGVNDHVLGPDTRIVSNASCTANALAPICKILDDAFGIERGFMTTVHAYTNDQRLADVPHTEMRRSRAAAENIIPTTTHSPKVVESILPQLAGRLDGMALNVPVPDGSTVDLVTWMKRDVTPEQVNEIVRSASMTTFAGIVEYTDQPVVSSDVVGNDHSAVFDGLSTFVLGGSMLKTITWYDNGWGYAMRVTELIARLAAIEAAGEVSVARPRVAINGFGRIGRAVFRLLSQHADVDVVAINDITPNATLAYLTRFDTVFGRFPGEVVLEGDVMKAGLQRVRMLEQKDPAKLPWGELGIDVVVEATGRFRTREECGWHIAAGASRVILTVPAKDDVDAMVVMGVNDSILRPEHRIVSAASCTTNCLAPVAKVLHESFGIVRGLITTVHAYTNDQRLADVPHKDLRRSRAANENIIPTTTGAARAVGKILPALKGKLDGIAMRVPVPDGSTVDLVAELERDTTVEAINAAVKEAASKPPLAGVLAYTEEPIVSSDIIQDPHSATFDALCTRVQAGRYIKVIAWYDNEWGYSCRVVDLIGRLAAL